MTRDYLELYSDSGDPSLPNHAAACWETAQVQRRRFEVFADLYPMKERRILDAGCSRGDFAQFLIDERIAFERYVGIDALPDVIAFANRRRLRRCEFYCGDLLVDARFLETGKPDAICISGTLNTLSFEQAKRLLEGAWRAAREVLLFNFLSDRTGPGAPAQRAPISRFPTVELIDWALARTSQIAFRQDYFPHGHDATIRMLKV